MPIVETTGGGTKKVRGTYRFLCEESCVHTRGGESWRGGKEYAFTEAEVKHLQEIGHLKRFLPLNESAIKFMDGLIKKGEDKPLTHMTLTELKEIAKERGMELDKGIKRSEVIRLLNEQKE